ncbi:hypothetical protein B0H11DRAFT_1951204 [Mycena galericulata]|nr:hypothetical protein B0H11DRAFT_1951204 [Mycena galericulata]
MSNGPGYKSMRFGDAYDEYNDGPRQLRPAILKTVQSIYRELAKDQRPPLDLDNWYHSAVLSYEIDPVVITLLVVEGENSDTFVAPQTRFCLVTDVGANPRGSLEDEFGGKPGRIPANISADFQPVRDWVKADINARGLNRPDAVAARAAINAKKAEAAAKDWENRLKTFYERVGIDKPVPTTPQRQKRCPKCKYELQSCGGCRIVCCIKPGCVSGVDGATGCMKHPHTVVYCLACRGKAPKRNLPEIMECPDFCKGTYCRADFSWCIGRISPPNETATTGIRSHEPKAVMCPKQCRYGRICCNPQCWSMETGGNLDGMGSRAVCLECGEDGRYCAGKHTWVCPECVEIGAAADTVRACDDTECPLFACDACHSRRGEDVICVNCKGAARDGEDSGSDDFEPSTCRKCGLWMCESCEAAEERGFEDDGDTY